MNARKAYLKSEIVIKLNRMLLKDDLKTKLSKNPDGSIPTEFIQIDGRQVQVH